MIDLDDAVDGVDRAYRERLQAFIDSEKSSTASVRWFTQLHPDYSRAQLRVVLPSRPLLRARIVLLAHRYFSPRKYSFSLLLGRERIVGLDIGPKRSHQNRLMRQSVGTTHWQYYPCTVVIPDSRDLLHRMWLDEFCRRCNIAWSGKYASPPHGHEQLRLWL